MVVTMESKLNPIVLKSLDLRVSLVRLSHGVAFAGLRDEKTGTDFFSGERALFTLTLKSLADGQMKTLDSLDGWEVSVKEGGSQITLCRPELRVFLSAVCGERRSAVEWTVSCAVLADGLSLQALSYPNLYADVTDELRLFLSHDGGVVYSDLSGQTRLKNAIYPSCEAAMAYMAFWDQRLRRGLYYGVHDRFAAVKTMSHELFSPDETKFGTVLRLFSDVPAENVTRARNSQTLGGRLVWELFDGDWYDAAILYREFVEAEASWLPARGRGDIPRWMRENPHWWLVSVTDTPAYIEKTLAAQEDLGVPSSVHLYEWHRNPFDNDYPHYFPARDCFLDTFSALQERGLHVMPYINGRLWDTRDRGAEDWLFSSVAKAGATKDAQGNVFTEHYGSKEADGSDVELAVMCPQSGVWRDKVRELCERLFSEVGADAVYIDQIAAAPPVLCCDEEHNHPAGGGRWWVEAYQRMLESIARTTVKTKTCTTECLGDAYMKHLSGLLSWSSTFSGQVSAFSTVYAGYIEMIGRNYNGAYDDETLKIFAAQSLLFGEQMGWLSPDRYLSLTPALRGYYRALVQTRFRYNPFFFAGRPLRPPVVECGLPDVCGKSERGDVAERAVLAAVWERFDSGERLLLVTNLSERPADIVLRSEYLSQLPAGLAGAAFDGGALRMTLEPQSVAAAVLQL